MGVVVAQTCLGVHERLNPFWLRLSGGNCSRVDSVAGGINIQNVSYGLIRQGFVVV